MSSEPDDATPKSALSMDDIEQSELDKIAGGNAAIIIEPKAGDDVSVAHMNPKPGL